MSHDIETVAKYNRVMKVYESGVTEKGTRADIEGIGDFKVLMHCEKGFDREVPIKHSRLALTVKGFKIGPAPKAKKTKKAEKDVSKEELFEAAGGSPKGALKEPEE